MRRPTLRVCCSSCKWRSDRRPPYTRIPCPQCGLLTIKPVERRTRRLPIVELSDVFRPENCIKSPSGCWLWTGRKSSTGYGFFRMNKKAVSVHRFVYQQSKGLAKGLLVCHKCDTPACINIDHLFAGTYVDNMQDMISKGRHRFGGKRPGLRADASRKEGK